jgi:pimeloyl-ACP methyl ester carboxylesterase
VPRASPPARDLRLASSDGVWLAATYWPGPSPRSPGLLLLHGNGASRAAFAQEGALLTRSGFAALAGPVLAILVEPLLSWQALPRFGVAPAAMSPERALRRPAGPLLVVGGERDRYTPPAETRRLYAAAPGPKRLWWARGLDHARVGGRLARVPRGAVGFPERNNRTPAARGQPCASGRIAVTTAAA